MPTSSATLAPKSKSQKTDIGLSAAYSEDMSVSLSEIFLHTYQLLIKSHVYHWNVVGPLFKPIHELLEAHYNELFSATDIIAERIRSIGYLAPVQFSDISKFAPSAKELDHLSAEAMVEDLIVDHQRIAKMIRKCAEEADKGGDLVNADMLTARLTFHEKALWMLRAIVAK